MHSNRSINVKKDGSIFETMDKPTFTNLIFEGGGPKGMVYIGAVKSLEEKGVLDNIKRVGGSSAGAMTAVCLALGCNAEEFNKVSQEIKLSELLDPTENSEKLSSKRRMALGMGKLLLQSMNSAQSRYAFHGIELYKKIKEIIKTRIAEAIKKYPDIKQLEMDYNKITFDDIRRISELHPDLNFKDLAITGSNLTDKKLEIFSADTTPLMEVALATRISMSLPLFFRPVQVGQKFYVDGGALNNFPMDIFDKEPYISRDGGNLFLGEQGQNLRTLGLRVDDSNEMKEILWQAPKANSDKSKPTLIDQVIELNASEAERNSNKTLYEKYSQQTIQIWDTDQKTTDFDVSMEKAQQMIHSGSDTTNTYLDNHANASLYNKYNNFYEMIERLNPAQLAQLCKDFMDPDTQFNMEGETENRLKLIREFYFDYAKSIYTLKLATLSNDEKATAMAIYNSADIKENLLKHQKNSQENPDYFAKQFANVKEKLSHAAERCSAHLFVLERKQKLQQKANAEIVVPKESVVKIANIALHYQEQTNKLTQAPTSLTPEPYVHKIRIRH